MYENFNSTLHTLCREMAVCGNKNRLSIGTLCFSTDVNSPALSNSHASKEETQALQMDFSL